MSVTDFAVPVPRKGSIDIYSGFGRGQQAGLEIHQSVQEKLEREIPRYKSEVWISREFEKDDYVFEIGGRMDGFYDEDPPRIEEIKTSFNVYELFKRLKDGQDDHPYCLQLKTYGYFHWLNTGHVPALQLLLLSTRNGDSLDLTLQLDVPTFENWRDLRLAELVEEAKLAEKRSKRRVKAAETMAFPFEKPRPGQIELIATIEEGMNEKRPMLIQAPTGLGKTVGVLYPTLREALGRGQRVIYVTPKNSQHDVAEDAIERLQETGANIKSMTMTAKSKICFKNEPICNPDFCEFAKDHYTKVSEHKLVEQLSKKKRLTTKVFKKVAEEHQVCPFELQIDAAQEADTIICDYNYVFAPRSALSRMSGIELDQKGKPNLVIDEAHNLPSRTMDYYSPELSTRALENMREDILRLPDAYRAKMLRHLNNCIDVVKNAGPAGCVKACKITPPVGEFMDQDAELREFLSNYLKADVDIQPKDPVMRLSYYWSQFTEALEFVNSGRKEFFTTYSPAPPAIRITCCDASEMLKECYDQYSQVVGFSATLKPFDFYSRLAGLHEKELKTSEFVSPFPRERRKLLIIPQISSKYSERERNYPKIAETIKKIAGLKRGNYFAFFPSFDFMEKVFRIFEPPEGFDLLKQERYMRRDAVRDTLAKLAEVSSANILFAVQGGVFSEGVDYPGDMAIGAFVIGPPLPIFDLERETMREYYQQNYAAGFDYAYTYPAMAKAVQAAGRVIRSETDRGVIVLMDNRFIQPSYAKSMPQDWFEQDPREMVSDSILRDVAAFWAGIN